MRLVTIYSLSTQEDGIRYIGMTKRRLCHRLHSHWHDSRLRRTSSKDLWLLECERLDKIVVITALEIVSEDRAADAERDWIARFENLTNCDEETRKQRAANGIRRALSNPRTLAQFQSRVRAMSANPEIRAKISETVTALHRDPVFRERQKQGRLKRSADPTYRVNLMAGARRRSATPEWRKNQSAAAKRRWADPAYRANQAAARAKRQDGPCA